MMKRYLKSIDDNRKRVFFAFFFCHFALTEACLIVGGLGPSVACRGRQPSWKGAKSLKGQITWTSRRGFGLCKGRIDGPKACQ